MPKKGGGLGQFVDLRGGGGVAWQEKGGRVFEGGGGGGWKGKKKGVVFLRGELIPQCTLTLEAKLLKIACNFPCMCKFILVHA